MYLLVQWYKQLIIIIVELFRYYEDNYIEMLAGYRDINMLQLTLWRLKHNLKAMIDNNNTPIWVRDPTISSK